MLHALRLAALALIGLGLSACGGSGSDRDPALMAEMMQISLLGQVAALCPATSLHDLNDFGERASLLGLSTDSGPVHTDLSMQAEITHQAWIASQALGARSTVWRADYADGIFNFFAIWTPGEPPRVTTRPYRRAFVCVAHAPHLTQADGEALFAQLEMNLTQDFWPLTTQNADGVRVAAFRKILRDADQDWQEYELLYPDDEGDTGVTLIRRTFLRPAPTTN